MTTLLLVITMIESPKQIKMARAALDWRLQDLSDETKINSNRLSQIENGRVTANSAEITKIEQVFQDAGIEFIENCGVREITNLDLPSEGIEVIYKGGQPLKRVARYIDTAHDNVIVYGRGPAEFDDIQEEYMTAIIKFLKHTPYAYTRILLASNNFPESSYLWLSFMKRLILDIQARPRVNLKILETDPSPGIYTPIQIVGNNFVHYTLGQLSFNPALHINNMHSFFVYGQKDCEIFLEFFKETLINLPGSIPVNNTEAINNYIDKYKAMIEVSSEESKRNFVRLADKFINKVCEPFAL